MNSPSGRMSSPGASAMIVEMRSDPGGTLTTTGTQAVSCTVTGKPTIIGGVVPVTGLRTAPTLNEAFTGAAPAQVGGGAIFAVVDAPGARSVGVAVKVNGEPATSVENPIASGTLPVFFTTTARVSVSPFFHVRAAGVTVACGSGTSFSRVTATVLDPAAAAGAVLTVIVEVAA